MGVVETEKAVEEVGRTLRAEPGAVLVLSFMLPLLVGVAFGGWLMYRYNLAQDSRLDDMAAHITGIGRVAGANTEAVAQHQRMLDRTTDVLTALENASDTMMGEMLRGQRFTKDDGDRLREDLQAAMVLLELTTEQAQLNDRRLRAAERSLTVLEEWRKETGDVGFSGGGNHR